MITVLRLIGMIVGAALMSRAFDQMKRRRR